MIFPIKAATAVGLLLALGACGSSSDTATRTFGATEVSDGENPAGLTATYDSSADTVIVSDGTTDYVYASSSFLGANGPLSGYQRDGTNWFDYAIFGQTSTGAGTVTLINSTEDGLETLAGTLVRIGTTTIPEAGSTNYAGSYLGQFYGARGPGGVEPVGFEPIRGDVTLTADFGDVSTISGAITNRIDDGGISYADLDLELATITGGGFTGVASGGELAGETTSDGTYRGLLTGAEATEVVGGLSIEHGFNDEFEIEVGVFIAEEP